MTQITISIECVVTMDEHDVWPNDSSPAPEIVTEATVMDAIKESLGTDRVDGHQIMRLLNEWNLSEYATLDIAVEKSGRYRPVME